MITELAKNKLKNNWGEKADSLNCFAEVKFIDTLSSWKCFVYAMDDNEEEVRCLIYTDSNGLQLHTCCISDIQLMYNEHGESPVIDTEYRPIRVTEIIRRFSA